MDNQDILLQMQGQLKRALAKPIKDRQWVMVIDIQKCVGCHACTVSCISENVLPPGVIYRRVMEKETGVFPKVKKQFFPRPCMQCDNPPCVPACPVQATTKRPDRVVDINYDECIGCGRCFTACIYGARSMDAGRYYTEGTPQVMDYETRMNYEYQKKRSRKNGTEAPIGRARKCHFCVHKVAEGLLPGCVVTCIGRATYFGDLGDPTSTVAQLLKNRKAIRILEEKGTMPRVYYLV